MEIQQGGTKQQFKRISSKMNEDEGDDASFEKKHKKEDFDEDVPF